MSLTLRGLACYRNKSVSDTVRDPKLSRFATARNRFLSTQGSSKLNQQNNDTKIESKHNNQVCIQIDELSACKCGCLPSTTYLTRCLTDNSVRRRLYRNCRQSACSTGSTAANVLNQVIRTDSKP